MHKSQNMFNMHSSGSVDFYTVYGFAHFLLHLQKSQQGIFSTLHGHTSLWYISHICMDLENQVELTAQYVYQDKDTHFRLHCNQSQ